MSTEIEKADAEKRLNEFSNRAIELALSKGKKEFAAMKESMKEAIIAFKKLNPAEATKLVNEIEENITQQFFLVMRHYMDYTEVTDPEKVKQEIYKKIPTKIPLKRYSVSDEGKNSYEEHRLGHYFAAIAMAQGPREKMEDEHLVTQLSVEKSIFGTNKIQLFAIFDGHGGSNCAKYVKQQLPEILKKELGRCESCSDIEIYNALRRTFVLIDKNWKNLPIQKTEFKDVSGTTATVSLIICKALWVANVGDSRVVLEKKGRAKQLSEEAKATVKKYVKEIYLRGGTTRHGRVIGSMGSLDMARSIGDIEQPSVSALPTIRKIDITTYKRGTFHIIMACDGLWDVVSAQMAAKTIWNATNIRDGVLSLKKMAYEKGSTDNVSVMIIDYQ